jgi:hypothetical protein
VRLSRNSHAALSGGKGRVLRDRGIEQRRPIRRPEAIPSFVASLLRGVFVSRLYPLKLLANIMQQTQQNLLWLKGTISA